MHEHDSPTPIDHAEFVAWCAQGHKDAHGQPMSDWLLCLVDEKGRAMRDRDGRQLYETQAEWLARHGSQITTPAMPVQQALFA